MILLSLVLGILFLLSSLIGYLCAPKVVLSRAYAPVICITLGVLILCNFLLLISVFIPLNSTASFLWIGLMIGVLESQHPKDCYHFWWKSLRPKIPYLLSSVLAASTICL